MLKPLRVIVLGYGIRGRVYASLAKANAADFTLAGVADPLARPGDEPGAIVWRDWREALDSNVQADAAIVALPDAQHLPASIAALEKGLHVLLEKPIGCSWAECLAIRDAQRKARRIVLTGFVLRYSPFYRRLREVVASDAIGELTSVHHLVAVSYGKAAHAFCRGNWAREADGATALVQKCTHDFDLVEWWTRGRRCLKVSSFGSLMHWRPENRPAGAADRCSLCPAEVRSGCPFDAAKLYLERSDLRYHFADESDEAMREVVEKSRYGRCVYACGNDAVDHQTVLMEYDGGLTITIEMECYSKHRSRITRFYGTRGEIVADGEKIEVMPFDGEPTVIRPESSGHHGGGDSGIMSAFARLARTASPERYAKIFDAALEAHRLAFLAEDSRRSALTVAGE